MRRLRDITVLAVLLVVVVGALATIGVLAVVPGAPTARASAGMSASAPKPAAVAPAEDSEASALAAKTAKRITDRQTQYAIEVLGRLEKQYKHLDDVSVTLGQTPKGEEAVAYYTGNEIVIDTEHSVGIEKILAHEIWHVIDWRDNGELDWGEDLPPSNSSDYLK